MRRGGSREEMIDKSSKKTAEMGEQRVECEEDRAQAKELTVCSNRGHRPKS
jgi:hypothetical protein